MRVRQLEADQQALAQENQTLRRMLERVIEHRQKSHGQLINILAGLVSKLPINEVGPIVSQLVLHNEHVAEISSALVKGTIAAELPEPASVRNLDQAKRELLAALATVIEEFVESEPPLDPAQVRAVAAQPELFFSPSVVRANRCYVKGHVPRERIVREFGEAALACFNDLTTDPARNPWPKPEEIVLGFKTDGATLIRQSDLRPEQREALLALHERVERSQTATPAARAQRGAFQRMSFLLELLHYYEHQNTESPEGIFAQRLPVLIEQLVLASAADPFQDEALAQAEKYLAYVTAPDHRLMVVNNIGKGGGLARTVKFLLRLRTLKGAAAASPAAGEIFREFVRHLIPAPPQPPPSPQALAVVLRLVGAELQMPVLRTLRSTDRLGREPADTLAKAVARELGLKESFDEPKAVVTIKPEAERQIAWDKIQELITHRGDPAAIAIAIRERLHTHFEADEVRQSWITLVEADAITLLRTLCQLPYLPDGRTDPLAQAVLDAYVTRLTHEKYAATYTKVLHTLKGMLKTNPNAPFLLKFLGLVRWANADIARQISADIGLPAQA